MSDEVLVILNKIKNGKTVNESDTEKLTLNDLLKKDDNNITYLEYCCKGYLLFLNKKITKEIGKNKEALYICINNGCLFEIGEFDENILFENISENKTLVEYIFEKQIGSQIRLSNIHEHLEILDYFIRYNQSALIEKEFALKLFEEKNGVYPIDKYIKLISNGEQVVNEIVKKTIDLVPIDCLLKYCKKSLTIVF